MNGMNCEVKVLWNLNETTYYKTDPFESKYETGTQKHWTLLCALYQI